MQEKYQVSRGTVRQALDLLESDGYIQKVKGKGSIVLPRQFNFSMNSLISFKEISKKMNVPVKTKVVDLSLQPISAQLQKIFEVGKEEKVWRVERLRIIDGVPSILDVDFFLEKYVSTLSLTACENSIYEYIENELDLKPSISNKIITIEKARENEKALLELDENLTLAIVRSKIYSSSNELFQYSISKHKASIFEFSSVARR